MPVVVQFLWTQHKYRLVTIFIVLDDRKRGKSLTKTYTVSKNTTIISLQLIDNGKGCISLEIVKLIPNFTLLKARSLVWQHILRDVSQKLMEDIIKRNKIDELRRVLFVNSFDILQDALRNITHFGSIFPETIKILYKCLSCWSSHLGYLRTKVVTLLAT